MAAAISKPDTQLLGGHRFAHHKTLCHSHLAYRNHFLSPVRRNGHTAHGGSDLGAVLVGTSVVELGEVGCVGRSQALGFELPLLIGAFGRRALGDDVGGGCGLLVLINGLDLAEGDRMKREVEGRVRERD